MCDNGEARTASLFVRHFLNEAVGDFTGWNIVIRRLKNGREVLKQYSDYLRQRALMEEVYGKTMLRLSKLMSTQDDDSVVGDALEALRFHTDMSSLSHLETARRFYEEANHVAEVGVTLSSKRKLSEEGVRQSQQKLKLNFRRLIESKQFYEGRCKEEIGSNQCWHQEIAKHGHASKEADKAFLKLERARQALRTSESEYNSSVIEAETARQQWMEETRDAYETFEEIEITRITALRNSLWKVANFVSTGCVVDDRYAEEMRLLLERCDVSDCLQSFAESNGTGGKWPEQISFKESATSASEGLGRAEEWLRRWSDETPTTPWPADTASVFNSLKKTQRADSSTSDSSLGSVSVMQTPNRPKKPPRLIHYAEQARINAAITSRSNPLQFPVVDNRHLPIAAVDNLEYFRLSGSPAADFTMGSNGCVASDDIGLRAYYPDARTR